jgi:hypothetical protein
LELNCENPVSFQSEIQVPKSKIFSLKKNPFVHGGGSSSIVNQNSSELKNAAITTSADITSFPQKSETASYKPSFAQNIILSSLRNLNLHPNTSVNFSVEQTTSISQKDHNPKVNFNNTSSSTETNKNNDSFPTKIIITSTMPSQTDTSEKNEINKTLDSLPFYKKPFLKVPFHYSSFLTYISFSLKSRDFVYAVLDSFLLLVSSSSPSFSSRTMSLTLIHNGILTLLILLSFLFLILLFFSNLVEKEMIVGENNRIIFDNENIPKTESEKIIQNLSFPQDKFNPFVRNHSNDFKLSMLALSILTEIIVRMGKFFKTNLSLIFTFLLFSFFKSEEWKKMNTLLLKKN